MVLPAPASIRMVLPPRRIRKLFTGMWSEPSAVPPTSRSDTARSMPTTRSSEVLRMPSLRPCTSTSPTRMLGSAISKSFPGQRDHAAGGDYDGGGENGEGYNEGAAGHRPNLNGTH